MQPINLTPPRIHLSKISKILCAMTLLISFLSFLPNFSPFCTFIPASLLFRVPFFLIFLFAIFQETSFFSILFTCLFILIAAQLLEPALGSREFLRIYLMSGFFTNVFVWIFAFIMYLLTQNELIMYRHFTTTKSISTGLIVTYVYVMKNYQSRKICGFIKLRHLPFYIILINSIISFFSMKCDSFLSSLCGFAVVYCYFRFIRRKRNQNGVLSANTPRGDPNFDIKKLIPFFDAQNSSDDGDNTIIDNGHTQLGDDNTNNPHFQGTPHQLG